MDQASNQLKDLYQKYKTFTMIPEPIYIGNLELCKRIKDIEGDIVECGVWRGGMVAALAEILGDQRTYYLYDSFEGLPQAKEIDGTAALKWQADKASPMYFDNCRAKIEFSETAMRQSKATHYKIIKGWFSETLRQHNCPDKIALLRLDADWYESTTECLNALFGKVVPQGIVIIDDYYVWEGCSRAVHDFLSKNHHSECIRQSNLGICYIIKNGSK